MVIRMNLASRRVVSYLLAALLVPAVSLPLFAGEAFRIRTKVFVGDVKEPVSKSTTLFQNGVVYDFLEQPEQTAVFRKPMGDKPGRFVLLNNKHRVQTEIATDKLSDAMKKLREWAAEQQNPFLRFAANPRFDETFDRESGKLVLTSQFETYTVDTSPASLHQDSMGDYREFLDWYTQLNTLLTSPIPPNPRMQLNDALVRRHVVPTKVELKRDGEEPLRAEHDFTWRLSQDDLQRIDDVQTGLASYSTVDNKKFLEVNQPVATSR